MKKFWLVMFYLVGLWLFTEALGYGYFWLTSHKSPYAWGQEKFQVPHLSLVDHPYLPYIATKGKVGFIEFNSLGDRGKEPEKPKTKIRVIAFGGSTTFDAAHEWEETWPGYLQAMLGEQFEVINAAQNGATTADTLVNLALIHLDLDPNFILLYEGTNDLESSYATEFKADYSHRRRDVGKTSYPFFDRLPRWLDHSSLLVLTRYFLVGDRGQLWSLYTRPESKYDFAAGPQGTETFIRNIKNINALAEKNGTQVVVGTFQLHKEAFARTLGQTDAEAWEKGIDIQNDLIRDLAHKEPNLYLAEIEKAFVPGGEYIYDGVHLTTKGNEEIAKVFFQVITSALTK